MSVRLSVIIDVGVEYSDNQAATLIIVAITLTVTWAGTECHLQSSNRGRERGTPKNAVDLVIHASIPDLVSPLPPPLFFFLFLFTCVCPIDRDKY